MTDHLEQFYFALCSRCLCNDNNCLESEQSKTVNEIKLAIANDSDKKSRLLGLSILRLACELLKTCKPCVLIYNFCARAAPTICYILLNILESVDPFVNYLSRKTLILLVQHFPDTCSFCVAELCDGVNTGTSQRLLSLVEILGIKTEVEVSELSLAGQETSSECSTEVNPNILISRNNILKTQKFQWTLEIEKHASVWFQKFNFASTPILNLWCQLLTTSLDMQNEDVITSLIKFEIKQIFQNLILSQKSRTSFIGTLKSILTSNSLSSNLRERLSSQFIACVNEDQLDCVCKIYNLKEGAAEMKEPVYDNVIVRNMISCSLFSLLNVEHVKWKNVFKALFLFLEKSNTDIGKSTYEELIISLFLDQDDEIVNMILCHVDLYLKYKSNNENYYSPFKLFREFLRAFDFDHSVLLDMLISNETKMLLLLVRFLKLAISEWGSFVKDHSAESLKCQANVIQNDELDKTMSVFVKLNLSIERFEGKGIFPYKVSPLLRLLSQIEECYEAL